MGLGFRVVLGYLRILLALIRGPCTPSNDARRLQTPVFGAAAIGGFSGRSSAHGVPKVQLEFALSCAFTIFVPSSEERSKSGSQH